MQSYEYHSASTSVAVSNSKERGATSLEEGEDFIVLQELRERDRRRYINKQEGVALRESIEGVCINFPDIIKKWESVLQGEQQGPLRCLLQLGHHKQRVLHGDL